MNEDRIAGTAKNIGGKVEEGLGRVTGDLKTQVEGAAQQIAGSAQDLYGQAKDRAADAAQAVREKSGGCRGLCAQEHREPTLHRSRHCTRRRFPDRTNGTPRLLVTSLLAGGAVGRYQLRGSSQSIHAACAVELLVQVLDDGVLRRAPRLRGAGTPLLADRFPALYLRQASSRAAGESRRLRRRKALGT